MEGMIYKSSALVCYLYNMPMKQKILHLKLTWMYDVALMRQQEWLRIQQA